MSQRYLKKFFSKNTDDDLISIVEISSKFKNVIEHFDGYLIFPDVTETELKRRCDAHLALFFGI